MSDHTEIPSDVLLTAIQPIAERAKRNLQQVSVESRLFPDLAATYQQCPTVPLWLDFLREKLNEPNGRGAGMRTLSALIAVSHRTEWPDSRVSDLLHSAEKAAQRGRRDQLQRDLDVLRDLNYDSLRSPVPIL